MPNVYARPTALSSVCGRVNYISDPKRQEHLVAVYSEVDQQFWKDLSKHCQKQAAEAGHKKACEGREWHGALPNVYAELYKDREQELAKEISKLLKEATGTDNIIALHWNKSKTNFHFHGICSENKEVNEVSYGAELTRNTYYNASGKRSTKKECLDPDGNLLPGCKFYKKGSRIETICRFGTKEDLRHYTVNEAIKKALADKFNQDLNTEQFQIYKNDGLHLKTQKVGKYTPEAIKIKIEYKNKLIKSYNEAVDEILKKSKLMGAEIYNNQLDHLLSFRNTIKKHRNTDKWIKAIEYYLKVLEDRKTGLQNILNDTITDFTADKQPEKRDGMSIVEKMQSASKEVQLRPKPEQKQKSAELSR